ncbi:uncharacterized protein PADG_08687 [Paracoccidioides brasiliensis Pb18]|uniref:Uncharacterized protein n=1 Tax=Paracoccidioides brasiliensis (strain Pb18) TaxID=502780 RepID=C1GN43_PARBD|nr:uncharacterized protein PADG_08687 [Paracoccidioides brasiliensis Pb18]EEH46245.2 hypothetical protein PADG_08687 [Paracoccidioides brasiliensis Pb18]
MPLSLSSPSIIAVLGFPDLHAQLMTASPYAAACEITVSVSNFDMFVLHQALHSSCFSESSTVEFLGSSVLTPEVYLGSYGCQIVCSSSFACVPPLLGWLSSNSQTTVATGLVIALSVSFGIPGQIAEVWVYKPDKAMEGYPTGHLVNAALLLIICVHKRMAKAVGGGGWRKENVCGLKNGPIAIHGTRQVE